MCRPAELAGGARPQAHDHSRPEGRVSGACRSGLPNQARALGARAGGRYRVGASERVRSPDLPIPSAAGLDVSTTPYRPGRSRIRSGPHSIPPPAPDSAFSPRPGASVLAPLQARTGTGRGGNAESNHSASTRQQQTYRRSTAWSQAGLRGRRFRRQRRPARATERSARRPAPRSVTRPNE
jgi:hypothetical protein